MRTFIFALAAIVPASCAIDRAWAADALPAFDIARNCNAEVKGLGTSVEACTKDETDAKNELAKRCCSTAIEFDATDRKLPQPDRSHRPWNEANGSAKCGKSARCVRRGGGWKRGTVARPAGAPVLDPTDERDVETELWLRQ